MQQVLEAGWIAMQAGGLVFGLGVSLFVLAHVAVGEQWRWVAFANNFIPWWALGGVVVIAFSLFSSWRVPLVAVQLPGIVLFVLAYGMLLVPRSEVALASANNGLTVATYNILSLKSDPDRVVAMIESLDADIVGVEELGPEHAARMETLLAARYPYRAFSPSPSVFGIGLLSRYPIREHTIFQPFPDSMRYLRAVLDVNGVDVVVYAVHPPPPDDTLSPLTYNSTRRDAEIRLLLDGYLAHERGPVIVLGDFNMTDQSDAYAMMDDALTDAFRASGRGLGLTWPARTPGQLSLLPRLIRIDYVWHSDHFAPLDAHVGHSSGTSDHHPVIASLALQVASGDEAQP